MTCEEVHIYVSSEIMPYQKKDIYLIQIVLFPLMNWHAPLSVFFGYFV